MRIWAPVPPSGLLEQAGLTRWQIFQLNLRGPWLSLILFLSMLVATVYLAMVAYKSKYSNAYNTYLDQHEGPELDKYANRNVSSWCHDICDIDEHPCGFALGGFEIGPYSEESVRFSRCGYSWEDMCVGNWAWDRDRMPIPDYWGVCNFLPQAYFAILGFLGKNSTVPAYMVPYNSSIPRRDTNTTLDSYVWSLHDGDLFNLPAQEGAKAIEAECCQPLSLYDDAKEHGSSEANVWASIVAIATLVVLYLLHVLLIQRPARRLNPIREVEINDMLGNNGSLWLNRFVRLGDIKEEMAVKAPKVLDSSTWEKLSSSQVSEGFFEEFDRTKDQWCDIDSMRGEKKITLVFESTTGNSCVNNPAYGTFN